MENSENTKKKFGSVLLRRSSSYTLEMDLKFSVNGFLMRHLAESFEDMYVLKSTISRRQRT